MADTNVPSIRANVYIFLACSLSILAVIGITLLFNSAHHAQSQATFSILAFACFSIAWSQVGELSAVYTIVGRIGRAATLAALIVSFVAIWSKNQAIGVMLIEPLAVCYLISYGAAHCAYFLNARSFGNNNILKALEASALVCISMAVITSFVIITNYDVAPFIMLFQIAFTFMLFSALITLTFSLLKRRMTMHV